MTRLYARTLSKSDFKIARTCDAKLWFRENGYPDNREFDAYLQMLAYGGYMVEALACAKYPEGIALEYGRDPQEDFARTMEYLSRDEVTLFQATLLVGRRLARVDIIEKKGNEVRLVEVKSSSFDGVAHAADRRDGGPGEFLTKKKPRRVNSDWIEKMEDLTFQTLMLEEVLPGTSVRPFLALVDKSKRSRIDEVPALFRILRRETSEGKVRLHSAEYIGTADQVAALDLVTEVGVTEEVDLLRAAVASDAERFEAMLDLDFDSSWSSHGPKCKDCEFRTPEGSGPSGFHHCWGELAEVTPHVLDLHRIDLVRLKGASLVDQFVRDRKASLLEIPEECLCRADGSVGPVATRQLRQIRCTRSGLPWHSDELRAKLESVTYPLHFIDFESSRLALPYHARMRPYGQVAFQWSCHTVASPDAAPVHREWLNTDYRWPNRAFIESLRDCVGDSATLIAWSPFEKSQIREIGSELDLFGANDPALAAWIVGADSRIEDICKWCADHFYHPGMGGRTSIKVVLDALWKSDSVMRGQFTEWTGLSASEDQDPYGALPGIEINGIPQDVHEGTGAIRAYEAMMYGAERDDPEARALWSRLLLQYCRLDSLSMVLIFEHWRRAVGLA